MFCLLPRYLNKFSKKAIYYQRHIFYQHKYNTQIEKLVNKQIQAEQQAAQEYLSIAVFFLHPSISRLGTGGFFMKMYNEELKHMLDFIHYQILRGGKPVICGLEPPNQNTNMTLLDAFKQGLDLEKRITKEIEEFIKVAEEMNEYHCADFLTSIFLTEQIQSINEMANHVTKLTHLSNNEHALYHYDLELAKLYPYSCKKI